MWDDRPTWMVGCSCSVKSKTPLPTTNHCDSASAIEIVLKCDVVMLFWFESFNAPSTNNVLDLWHFFSLLVLWRSQCEFYSVVPDAVAWNPSPSCRINYTRMQVRITDWKCGRPTSCGAEFFISMRIYRFNFYISGLLVFLGGSGLLVRLAYYQRVAPVFFLEA